MRTPDEIVSEKVIADLKERRLLREDDLPSVSAKLMSGKAKAADWQVWAENALTDREDKGNV